MNKNKDRIITTLSISILFLTAIVSWNMTAWLLLVAISTLLLAWYYLVK